MERLALLCELDLCHTSFFYFFSLVVELKFPEVYISYKILIQVLTSLHIENRKIN